MTIPKHEQLFEKLRKFLKQHFENEHGISLGRFELDAVIKIVAEHTHTSHYNQGVNDAATLISKKFDGLIDEILLLEKNNDG